MRISGSVVIVERSQLGGIGENLLAHGIKNIEIERKNMKIEKRKSAGWECVHFNCGEGEDEFPCTPKEAERIRNRAKYHHKKTEHEVHFYVSHVWEYKLE